MFAKIRASLDDPWTKGLVVVAVIAAIVALVLLLAGCGEEAGAPCVGKITKAYTTTSVSGGFSNVPASSSTHYKVAVKRDDGTGCSRKMKKSDWEIVEAGQYIDAEGKVTDG